MVSWTFSSTMLGDYGSYEYFILGWNYSSMWLLAYFGVMCFHWQLNFYRPLGLSDATVPSGSCSHCLPEQKTCLLTRLLGFFRSARGMEGYPYPCPLPTLCPWVGKETVGPVRTELWKRLPELCCVLWFGSLSGISGQTRKFLSM